MVKDQKPEEEIVKPIPNEDAWGLADHEMPAPPSTAEQEKIDEALGRFNNQMVADHVPDISQGSEVDYG